MQVIPIETTTNAVTELVHQVMNGDEVIFTEKEKPVAKMNALTLDKKPRKFGSAKDSIVYVADDFNETPEEFKEYIGTTFQ